MIMQQIGINRVCLTLRPLLHGREMQIFKPNIHNPHFSRALYVCGLYLYPTLVLDNPKIGGIVESIILFHDFRAELDF